jgi:hypothetical protein
MSVIELLHGWDELEAALPDYEEAEAYAGGNAAEVFANPKLRQMLARTGERYRFNLAKTPITVLANKLDLVAVTDPSSTKITDLITAAWDANDMDVHFPDLTTKMLTYGDAYLMAWESDDDSPITPEVPDDAQPDEALEQAGVEFTIHNPKNTRLIYDPENHRRKWFIIKRWCVPTTTGKRWRVDLWFGDRMERWVSLADTGLGEKENWSPFTGWPGGDPVAPEVENGFEEIPFFHFRTALPYGVPVHKSAYPAQDAINKMLITQITTSDQQGWPARFALMETGAELDQNHDDPDFPQDDDDQARRDYQRAAKSRLTNEPGSMNYMPGTKGVVQLSGAEPAVFLDPAEFYIRLMAQMTEIPMHHYDPAGEVPSGESLKVKDGPLNGHVLKLQKLMKGPVLEWWAFALKVLGSKPTKVLEARWAPAEMAVGKSDWEVIGLKQASGVPQHQTLVEAGYEPETVDTWLDDNQEEMDLFRRADLLDKVAGAAQKLGAAVSLGVMTADQAQEIIVRITGQKAEEVEGPPPPVPPADPANPDDEQPPA